MSALNVLDQPLQLCSESPLTGFFRNGYCQTESDDRGQHTVCAVVDNAFLQYTLDQGNDLLTPRPALGFPGLNRVIIGACAQHGGKKLTKKVVHLKSY